MIATAISNPAVTSTGFTSVDKIRLDGSTITTYTGVAGSEIEHLDYLPSRLYVLPYTTSLVIGSASTQYVFDNRAKFWFSSAISGGTIMFGTDSVSMEVADGLLFQQGDLLYWPVQFDNPVLDATVSQDLLALRVTNVSGTTVTADIVVDNVDISSTPAYLYGFRWTWVNAGSISGTTTSGSPEVTDVSGVSKLKIGDWIQGTNIPADTRIKAMSGTTVTLSGNATGSSAGGSLYNLSLAPL